MRYKLTSYELLKQMLQIAPDGDACLDWPRNTASRGYGQLFHEGRPRIVHRMAWEIVNGPIPKGLNVCHSCDRPSCFRPSHLWLGTDSDNMQDRNRKGRCNAAYGENHGQARLTEAHVREIRKMYADHYSQTAIGIHLGISRALVYHVVHRHTWDHVA